VVVRAVVPHRTVEPLLKFVPAIESVKAAPPAADVAGLSVPTAGAPTVNTLAADGEPLVLFTVT
jgi:hypothetical protein